MNARVPDRVRIVESYTDYEPPQWVFNSIKGLLDAIPEKYLTGLDFVLLTNHNNLTRKGKRRRIKRGLKKIGSEHVAGTYHQRFRNHPAYIRIVVDKGIVVLPPPLGWFSFPRDLMAAQTLFHELGHHVHATLRPEYKDPEHVAEEWRRKFIIAAMKKKHPVASRVIAPLARLIQALRKFRKRTRKTKSTIRS